MHVKILSINFTFLVHMLVIAEHEMAATITAFSSYIISMGRWATPASFTIVIILFLMITSLRFLTASATNPRKPPLPPGPTPWPLVGSLIPLLLTKLPRCRWVLRLAECKDITCIRFARTHVVIVSSPDVACEFLKKHDASFSSRPINMASEYLSGNFLASGLTPWGEQSKKMRKVVKYLVNPATLHLTVKLRAEEADHILRYVYKQCKNSPAVVDVRRVTRYFYGNLMRRMLFNRRHLRAAESDAAPGEEEVEHVEASFAAVSQNNAFRVSDYVPWLRWLDLEGHERALKNDIGRINKYHYPIIEERIKSFRTDGCIKKEPEDFLDAMIMLKDNDGMPLLSPAEIKAEAAELMFVMVDNASNIVEWSIASMLNNPHVLRKAVEELDRVVGKERLVQESDFQHLVYLKACARETIRLHPVSPFNLPHVAIHDTTVAGYFIPKGSQVLLNRVGLGRNPKTWPDPLEYDPDRHLKDGCVDVDMAEPGLRFMSFSVGRRGCPSSKLGSLVTYILLARLVHAFEWKVLGDSGVDMSEEKSTCLMANALHAYANPRLEILKRI